MNLLRPVWLFCSFCSVCSVWKWKCRGIGILKAWNFIDFESKTRLEHGLKWCWKLMILHEFDMNLHENRMNLPWFNTKMDWIYHDYARHFINFSEQVMEHEYYLKLIDLPRILHEFNTKMNWITTIYPWLCPTLYQFFRTSDGTWILSQINRFTTILHEWRRSGALI